MFWAHFLAASVVNIVMLIPFVIIAANLDPEDVEDAERSRTVIAISSAALAALLLIGFMYWQFIYGIDPNLIIVYIAMVCSAYVICMAILAIRGHLGYIQGKPDEPEWADIFAAILWSFFGPLVLIGLASELINQWKYRKRRKKRGP